MFTIYFVYSIYSFATSQIHCSAQPRVVGILHRGASTGRTLPRVGAPDYTGVVDQTYQGGL